MDLREPTVELSFTVNDLLTYIESLISLYLLLLLTMLRVYSLLSHTYSEQQWKTLLLQLGSWITNQKK